MKADGKPWTFQSYRRIPPVPRFPVKGELGPKRHAAALVHDHGTNTARLVPVLAIDINPEPQP